MPNISTKFDRGQSLWGRQMQVGWVKIGHFRQIDGYIYSKTVEDTHGFYQSRIGSRMRSMERVTFPMTLSAP